MQNYVLKRYEVVESDSYLSKSSIFRPSSRRNKAYSKQKTKTSINSWSSQFWKPSANIFVTLQNEKTSTQNLTHKWKDTRPNKNDLTTITNTRK